MKNNKQFLLEKNIPLVPLHYQFIAGNYFDENRKKRFYDNRTNVADYQTPKCLTYSHYSPISKIIDEASDK